MKTATSIEESRKLLSLGIDPETADMCYVGGWYNRPCCIPYSECKYKGEDMPAWSLSAIIDNMLPKKIDGEDSYCQLLMQCNETYTGMMIGYEGSDIYSESSDLFSACIDLIEQLVKQGYIKTKKV